MAFRYDQRTLRQLVNQIDSDELLLPNFQRDFTWDPEAMRSLIASFLSKIPTGGLLLLKGKSNDFSSRRLGSKDNFIPSEATHCEFLLDGQQRITTLRYAFYDLFGGPETWDQMWSERFQFYHLRLRWFLDLDDSDGDGADPLGFRTLSKPKFEELEPSELEEAIVFERVLKTQRRHWWHPSEETIEADSRNMRNLELANHCASDRRLPLFQIGEGEEGWLERSLRQLATTRTEELRAQVRDEPKSDLALQVLENLEEVEPRLTIKDISGKQESQRATEAWNSLRSDWVARCKTALIGVLDNDIPLTIAPQEEVSRAVATFEAVNRGGTPLDTFDLVVARAAKDPEAPNLSQRVSDLLKESVTVPTSVSEVGSSSGDKWDPNGLPLANSGELPKETKNWFLNILSLLVYREKGHPVSGDQLKGRKQLNLLTEEINTFTPQACLALLRAFCFFQYRCGVVTTSDVHYKHMASVVAFFLSSDDHWLNKSSIDKLEYWFWVTIFSGGMSDRQTERTVEYINNLEEWLLGKSKNPLAGIEKDLFKVKYYCDKTILARQHYENHEEVSPIPASVAGALRRNLVLSRKPKDLLTGESLDPVSICEKGHSIEEHHIIPLDYASTIEESARELRQKRDHPLNSPLNYTITLEATNRKFRTLSPGVYLNKVDDSARVIHMIPDHMGKWQSDPQGFVERRLEKVQDYLIQRLQTLKESP